MRAGRCCSRATTWTRTSPPRGHREYRDAVRAVNLLGGRPRPARGHAVDRLYPDIIYVPEDAHFDLPSASVRWTRDGGAADELRHQYSYVLPSGFKVDLQKPRGSRPAPRRHHAECTLCHKPSTVSGAASPRFRKA